jgi:hypothetical protein
MYCAIKTTGTLIVIRNTNPPGQLITNPANPLARSAGYTSCQKNPVAVSKGTSYLLE